MFTVHLMFAIHRLFDGRDVPTQRAALQMPFLRPFSRNACSISLVKTKPAVGRLPNPIPENKPSDGVLYPPASS